MLDIKKIRLFVCFCISLVNSNCLTNWSNMSIVNLLEECSVMATCLCDIISVMILYPLLGDAYHNSGQYKKAVEYHEKSLGVHKNMSNKRGEGNAYGKLGNNYQSLGEYQKAIECYEKCLIIAKDIGHKQVQGSIYANLGNSYRSLGEHRRAIEYHEKSLSIVKMFGNRMAEGINYGNLGNAYHGLGEHHKAIEYYEKGLAIAKETGNIEGEGSAFGNLGNVYRSLGEYHKAIRYQEKSLGIRNAIGDRAGKGNNYGSLGNVYESLGEYRKAIEYYERKLEIAKEVGNKSEEGNTYGNLGNAYLSLGEYQKAISYHKKSLGIAKESGNKELEGSTYGNLGIVYQASGEYWKAITYHEKSLGIAKEIGNKTVEGNACGGLGIAYRSLSEYHKAIEYHEKSLSIAKDIGNRAGEGSANGNLGNAYHLLGEYQKAIKYQERNLAISKEIGDKAGEGNSYGSLGNLYLSLGKYHKALECHEKGLIIAKEIGDRESEGKELANIGAVYESLGEYHMSIEYHQNSLMIAKEIGDRAGEGSGYGNIGNAYASLTEYQKAITYHEKSLIILKEIGDRAGEGGNYGSLGNAYQSLHEYSKAIPYHEKRLNISKEIGDRAGEGGSYGSLGNAYQSLGEYHKALECHRRSLVIAQEIGDRNGVSTAHHNLGLTYSSEWILKNLVKAEEHLLNSIKCYEELFDDLKEKDQFKISFVDTYVKTYKFLSEVQLQAKQPEKALLVCERGRARALKDLLSIKYDTTEASSKTSELNDAKKLSASCGASILFYDLHNNKLTARFWAISPRQVYFYDELVEYKSMSRIASQLSEDEIINIENGYFQHLVENSFAYMKVRQARCEDRSLESIEGKEASSNNTSEPSATACNVFGELSRCIYMMDGEDDGDQPLEVLFHRLIAPVLDKLTQDEIVIIPDGPLFMVAFAALSDRKTGEYLSETKRLRLAPSLTTLNILQESLDDHHSKSGALIIGDPTVGEVMYRGKKTDIYPLAGARDEAIEIGMVLGVDPLVGEEANKEAVLSKLQHGVSVIHIAAHGSSRNGQIFLAPSMPPSASNIPVEKDYILTMKEAQDSGIRAQLVVLSCCHSGRGDIKSEGVVGMTRAFLAAGARAVVASLWAIDDLATKFFMLKFYSHLKNGESASRSLQQAMKEMRETERYKDPMYWAAFFLIGDDVTVTV